MLPAFGLTQENATFVGRICDRLEGIPLAIELAAAKARVLSAEQISSRLDDSLRLLKGGSRTAAPRHRALRAALDWSYELLSEPEKRLLGRLSVFAGGFSLEAAEAVGAGNVPNSTGLELLSRLVEKSLVKVEKGPRNRLLEPVRQYALEKLEGSGEADEALERHAEYYSALAEEAELAGPDQAKWLERLETEHDNFRAALSWLLDGGENAELGVRLATVLGARFWNMRGPSEGRGWLERGLAGGAALPAALRARVLNEFGFIAMCQGDFRRSTEALEEGLALSRKLGDERGIAMSLGPLRFAALHNKENARLPALDRDTQISYRKMEDPWARGYLAISLGFAAAERGDFERSTGLHEEALTLFRELGYLRSIAMCLNGLGQTALKQGRYARAWLLFGENLRLLRKLKEKVGIQQGLLGVAAVCGACGDPARAARLWGAEEALREVLDLPLWRDFPIRYDYEGRLSAARRLLDKETWSSAWTEGRALTPEAAIEYALEAAEPPEPTTTYPAGLSRREVDVLRLVARGMPNAEIAEEFFVSIRTVRGHLGSIYEKLGSSSRATVTRFVVEHGLV